MPEIRSKAVVVPAFLVLFAANGSISTYGSVVHQLELGLRRDFAWSFIHADVPYPIQSADALAHFDLMPDLKRHRLIDNVTKLSVKGQLAPAPVCSISAIDPTHPLAPLLSKYPQAINPARPGSSRAKGVFHYLQTNGGPIAQRARRLAPDKLSAARKQFEQWCKEGTCRPSNSAWASPIHIVPKKQPNEFRVSGDYRKLNAITTPSQYPVRDMRDFTYILQGKKVFTTLDLLHAFNQIPMAPEDIEKTALITPFGLFEFLFMPFGLRNASQTFQKYVNQALGDLSYVFVYIDDVLFASDSLEQHQQHLDTVLKRLVKFSLQLNLSKCVFTKSKVVFLAHIINERGYAPLPDKVQAVQDFPTPQTIDELRRFLGLINFYQPFVKNTAHLLMPLNALIIGAKKKDTTPVAWN
uniref:Reverse transcriptase domain-containing protein n=1 Tax=Trichogramma kaykai TaxID=54128 RepID=A0ABD2WRS1_9HYME